MCMKVLRSSDLIAVVCLRYSRRLKYIHFISSTDVFLAIVFANTSTASSDTVLMPLICLIALRRYTEDSFLLVVPTESTSDHIGEAYNIIDVEMLNIIFLLNGFSPPIFGIIIVSVLWIANEFHVLLEVKPVVDNCSQVFYSSLRFDPSASNNLPATYQDASVLYATSVKPASLL